MASIESSVLDLAWDTVLDSIELPSTQMLLRQQGKIESIKGNSVTISVTSEWITFLESGKEILESAFKEVFSFKAEITVVRAEMEPFRRAKGRISRILLNKKSNYLQRSGRD